MKLVWIIFISGYVLRSLVSRMVKEQMEYEKFLDRGYNFNMWESKKNSYDWI